jgi:hypothetical protein
LEEIEVASPAVEDVGGDRGEETDALRRPAAAEEDAEKEVTADLAIKGASNLVDGDPKMCAAKKMDAPHRFV